MFGWGKKARKQAASKNACSFCNKPSGEVYRLMSAPDAAICDTCIILGLGMLQRAENVDSSEEHFRRALLAYLEHDIPDDQRARYVTAVEALTLPERPVASRPIVESNPYAPPKADD